MVGITRSKVFFQNSNISWFRRIRHRPRPVVRVFEHCSLVAAWCWLKPADFQMPENHSKSKIYQTEINQPKSIRNQMFFYSQNMNPHLFMVQSCGSIVVFVQWNHHFFHSAKFVVFFVVQSLCLVTPQAMMRNPYFSSNAEQGRGLWNDGWYHIVGIEGWLSCRNREL